VELSAALTPGKKIYGRKRHVLVDTAGNLLAGKVHTAGLADRDGAPLLLGGLQTRFPQLSHLFAEKGYPGPLLDWIKQHLGWTTEIVPGLTDASRSEGRWVWRKARPVWQPHPSQRPALWSNARDGWSSGSWRGSLAFAVYLGMMKVSPPVRKPFFNWDPSDSCLRG
jgi:hypothetical protein